MSTKRAFFFFALASILMLTLGISSMTVGAANLEEEGFKLNIPSVLAAFLGPENRICCGNEYDQRRPAVAYNRNHHEYMIVKYQALNAGGSISGARLGLDGYAFSHFLISPINEYDCCLYPDVAYNGVNDEYLVVWQKYNSGQSKWEIYGLIMPWDGPNYSLTPFLIAQWSSMNLKLPKVAWNSYRNEYMVVWQTESTANNLLLGIGRRRLGADGSFLSNADYITQPNFPGFPDITYNPAADQYVVVWAQTGTNFIDIYAGKLNRDGALQGSIFPISEADNEQQFPVIATNEQNRYLVVWQDNRWGDWDIYAQYLDGSANLVGGNFWIDISGEHETHPAVAANGATRRYLVAYQKSTDSGESIWANHIDENTVSLNWFEVSPGGLGDNAHPAVATHLSGYFLTYEWESWTPGWSSDIYGRMWSPNAVFLPLLTE